MNSSLITETTWRKDAKRRAGRGAQAKNGQRPSKLKLDVARGEAAVNKLASGESNKLASGESAAWKVLPATAADHHLVHQLLTRVFRGPSLDAFNVSLEDPFYEPCDRLVVRRGSRIVSHVLLSSREVQLGSVPIPTTQISWLGTLPEYRGQGFAQCLLAAAERTAAESGSVLHLLSTHIPRFFARGGWVACGRVSRWTVGTRHLLARLSDEPQPAGPAACIRPWRQVELPALVRLHAQSLPGTVGAPARNEAYWRWLIARRAFDMIYVATVSPGRCHLDDHNWHVVGYAITKDNELLELMADPARPEVARQLLHRVCGDALEMDCHDLAIHAPPGDPLGLLCRTVGGRLEHTPRDGAYIMAKLPDPLPLLNLLRAEFLARAAAGSSAPGELGLCVDREKHHLALTRRSVKITSGKLGRNYLRCDRAILTRLLLGALDVPKALAHEQLRASNRQAEQAASALFPRLPLWRPPLDERME